MTKIYLNGRFKRRSTMFRLQVFKNFKKSILQNETKIKSKKIFHFLHLNCFTFVSRLVSFDKFNSRFIIRK